MYDKINQIRNSFLNDAAMAKDSGDFDSLYLKYFSKTNGVVTNLVKQLPSLNSDEKREYGPIINDLQNDLKAQIEKEKAEYHNKQNNSPLLDLTYPLTPKRTGVLHPTTQVIREMNDFFEYYGYSIAEGPEIETAEYNFRKLNLPDGHPATDLQDTLFIKEPEILLRTHTSSIESRILSSHKPPLRVVVPGRVYRNETANASNLAFFHQYQGFAVDKGITIQHLKDILEKFLKFLFTKNVKIRFRYKYYPEVSPGMGVDILCSFCRGEGCAVCKFRGWVEVLGSGMIHYNILKACNIDPEVYTGFAFGMGLDRLVMTKFNINDIRKLYGEGITYN